MDDELSSTAHGCAVGETPELPRSAGNPHSGRDLGVRFSWLLLFAHTKRSNTRQQGAEKKVSYEEMKAGFPPARE
jgi:hypothetical protein